MKRSELIKALRSVQRKCCCYDSFGKENHVIGRNPPHVCDCKYGIDEDTNHGEKTGCPELRLVIAVLMEIPGNRYADILNTIKRKAKC
jgi:hypothetical protein